MRRSSSVYAFVALLAVASLWLALLVPRAARAEGAKAVALLVEGADAGSVAAEIGSVLPPELRVVEVKGFSEALRKAGQRDFGNALAVKGALRDKMLGRAQKAMAAVGADAAILGRVRIGKLGKEVWLVWLASDGSVAVDQAASLRGDSSDRRAALHAALDGPAAALVPPPLVAAPIGGDTGPDKPKDGPEPDKPPPPGARLPHLHGTQLFSIGVAFEMGGRHMTFSDPITANIRPYDVLGAPMIAAEAELYPAATTGLTVLKNIGLTGRFAYAVGLSSTTRSGTSTSNTWLRARGGLRWRFLPGSDAGPELALRGDVGSDSFTFDDAGALAGEVPSVQYSYLRAGGEVRLPAGPVAFGLGGGYRGLLAVGETGDRFQGGEALAFDAFFAFEVTLPAGFELRLAGDYSRVVYSFAPVVGDPYVAGGAVDEMLGARLGVAYVY